MDKILILIPSLIAAVTSISEYIQTVRNAAQQDNSWTPAMEDEFQSMLDVAKLSPQWQPDPPPPTPPTS